MDRREVLKKLAVGGAIAAGGSLVLSSNAVAATASGPGIVGIPLEGQPIPGATIALAGGDKQLGFQAPAPPAGVTANYSWNIQGYNVAQPQVNGLMLTSGGNVQRLIGQPTCGSSGCTYIAGSSSAITETLFRAGTKIDDKTKKFKNNDTVDVGLMIVWTAPGQLPVTAEFLLRTTVGAGITSSNMVTGSYRVG